MRTEKPRTRFANYIRKHREAQRLSQADVARALGYVPVFVSSWENGKSNPPVDQLKRLAKTIQCDENKLFELFLDQELRELTKTLKKRFGFRA